MKERAEQNERRAETEVDAEEDASRSRRDVILSFRGPRPGDVR